MTLHEIWFAFGLLLGGMLAPLDLFPPQVAEIARFLPFRYMLSFPVEIMLGRVGSEDLVTGFAVMGIWLVFLLTVYRSLWRHGLQQFGAFGA